jgi:hypothetical protein
MAVFLIVALPHENRAKLPAAINAAFPNANYTLDSNAGYLVSATTITAQMVSDRVGLTDGTNGAGIVVEVAAYYGRANPNIWTWIKNNWEGSPSGPK